MIDLIKFAAEISDINSLRKLRELLDDFIGTVEESGRQTGTLRLMHSIDRSFAAVGTRISYSAIITNTGLQVVEKPVLSVELPAELGYVNGSLTVDFEPVFEYEAILPNRIALLEILPGVSRVVRFCLDVLQADGKNPLCIAATCTNSNDADGKTVAPEQKLWVTDRSCIAQRMGSDMSQVMAQWTLTQLFGLPEYELGSMLEYLQNNKDDILSGFYAQ